jgi:alpha-beta hydrolase superfamily lysophospholipase
MGGLLVQKYLECNPATGAVLMASMPTGGVTGLVARFGLRHPLVLLRINASLSLRPLFGTPAMVRASAEIFRGMGHHMMLDNGWERVADRIDAWIRQVASRPSLRPP